MLIHASKFEVHKKCFCPLEHPRYSIANCASAWEAGNADFPRKPGEAQSPEAFSLGIPNLESMVCCHRAIDASVSGTTLGNNRAHTL